ncbi:MAG: VapB-type antitoxin [Aigarchaeota archaeon]|nr:VapB-type antitoxin [Candidatus Pelearchaeum maunauluense]
MSVVSIDERGRITLPRDIREMGDRAVVISAGSFAVVIPIPKKPEKIAGGWLKSRRGRKELGLLAEEKARGDAVARTRMRKQL